MEDWQLKPAKDLGMPLGERIQSLSRESGLLATATHFSWWWLVRIYMSIAHRLTVVGRANIPQEPPFVIVANHASHLDVFSLASPLPSRLRDRVFPIAAGDTFFATPTMAAFAAFALNALPMWRRNCGPHALKTLRQRLIEEPCVYVLFPEGTRSRTGTLQHFKSGVGMLVAESNIPVIPCYIDGAFQAWPSNHHLPRWRRIQISVGKACTFEDVKNNRIGWNNIAKTIEHAVRELSASTQTGGLPDSQRESAAA
jgi:1-acyl-sn-glycerol-3-phosphate acyltransferase